MLGPATYVMIGLYVIMHAVLLGDVLLAVRGRSVHETAGDVLLWQQ